MKHCTGKRFLRIVFPILSIGIVLLSCNHKEPQQPQPGKIPETPVVKKQMEIWPGAVPDSGLVTGTETYKDGMVFNVSHPTITVFSPVKNNTGAAVLVFPGGGYNKLAVELEGSEVCEWLASIGVTGILLKYRVPASGPHYDEACKCGKDAVKPMALQDAQRAVGLTRLHAREWNIDPNKIGVMGFSAGGHLVADVSANYRNRVYTPTDEADKISCRPDFGLVFFPGHMLIHAQNKYELNRTIPVDAQNPPMFILQAGNDPIDTIQNSLVYYIALKKAGVPAEYHIYAEGGHAFALRTSQQIPGWQQLPIAEWPKLAERWLRTIKMTR